MIKPQTLVLIALLVPALPSAADIRFRRVDRAWGIDFHHHDGASGRRYMVETNGSGVVLSDLDGDGDLDIFLADGAALPGYEGPAPRSRLFRNEAPGRFRDVTESSGIELDDYASGGAAGDVDGDGDLDLYVTAFGRNRLFLNDGDGKFREVGEAAGVADGRWSSSAGFADADGDGDLDLYVANYVDFTLANNKACGDERRGLLGYCGPDVYDPLPDVFYRNRGLRPGGRVSFEDATAAAGFGAARGAGLALSWSDLDGDGRIDLYVANDLTPNFLWKGRGDGTFEDVSLLAGTAYGHRGQAEAGMGVATGDFDGDGRIDVAVTNYEGETNALYRNLGSLVFNDQRFASGLGEPSLRKLAFGIAAADFDHDGDLDLVVANGHVRENAAEFSRSSVYKQPNQVFENSGSGRFREVAEPGFSHVGASRGLAVGDLDGDGDLDLVVSNVGDEVEVYENLHPTAAGSWLQVDLAGRGGNRFGVGARVELQAAGRRQLREVQAGGSFMSQHALTLHFGLGAAKVVDRLTVRWPGGAVQVLEKLPVDRRMEVVEPAAAAKPAYEAPQAAAGNRLRSE